MSIMNSSSNRFEKGRKTDDKYSIITNDSSNTLKNILLS